MAAKRLALCITDLEPGGAERCLVELAVRADPGRYCAEVYCLAPPPPSGRQACIDRLQQARIPVHFLHASRLAHFPLAFGRLAGHLRIQRPAVLQTFLFHANILGRLAARAAKVECVVCGIRVAQRGWRWRLWLDRLTAPLVDCHVCVSRAVAEFSRDQGRLPGQKLEIIPNGIDVGQYPAPKADIAALGVPAGREVITCVGRLEEQKGVDWLVDTAPHWLSHLADCDLLLVGEGRQRESLQRQVADLGIGHQVHFAGWQPNIPSILAASRMLVLPSRWEGMPNVVLEAMASRLPIVASDVEGVRELLGPEASRQVVRHGDSRALGERILSIAADPTLAIQLGEANRVRAEEAFPISRMVKLYQDLWDSLLRSNEPRTEPNSD